MCLRYALGDLVVLEPLPAGHHDVRILFEAGPVFGRCWSRDDAAATVEPYLWWDPVVKAGAMGPWWLRCAPARSGGQAGAPDPKLQDVPAPAERQSARC